MMEPTRDVRRLEPNDRDVLHEKVGERYAATYFTDDHRADDCEFCQAGACVQQVVWYDGADGAIVVHNAIVREPRN